MLDQNAIRAYNALIEKQDDLLDHMRERAKNFIEACPRDLRRVIEKHLSEETFEPNGTTYEVSANRLLGMLRLALRGAGKEVE